MRRWESMRSSDPDRPHRPPTRSILAVVTLGFVVLVAAACGGGDSSTPTTEAKSSTSTTITATDTEPTTTDAPRPDADPATVELAKAATLQAGDFPAGWVVHTEARAYELSSDSCAYRKDGPEARLGTGAAQVGPSMQLDGKGGFITSYGYVFASEEEAVDWIKTVRSDEWADCKRKFFDDFQAQNDSGIDVRLESRRIEHLGENGFEAYAAFHGLDENGKVAMVVNVMHYRLGRVVIEDTLERSVDLADEDWAAVDTAHAAAVAAAWARLNDLPTR